MNSTFIRYHPMTGKPCLSPKGYALVEREYVRRGGKLIDICERLGVTPADFGTMRARDPKLHKMVDRRVVTINAFLEKRGTRGRIVLTGKGRTLVRQLAKEGASYNAIAKALRTDWLTLSHLMKREIDVLKDVEAPNV